MKCLSCEFEINPKWKAAIERNECPSCGQSLMNSELKENLSQLRAIMDKMSKFPEELDDWMRSNFNYIKADHPDVQKALEKANNNFKVKIKTDKGEEEVSASKVLSKSQTDSFFKRANTLSSTDKQKFTDDEEKTSHYKDLVRQIKKTGSTSVEDTGDDIEASDDDHIEVNPNDDSASANEYAALLDGGFGADQETANLQATVLGMSGNNGKPSYQDLIYLQKLKDKVENPQEFEGSNKKLGGFSRT